MTLSLPQKSLKAILELAASGAVGVALLLGAAPAATAAQAPSDQASDAAQSRRVSDRLAAIRETVSEVAKTEAGNADGLAGQRLAWHNWGNGGGWHHPWGNAGWGRPWGNYGYGYRSPWNNWRNGWNNWRNGWGNWR
jgi:rSAM-associated Gly-rich repeat protein